MPARLIVLRRTLEVADLSGEWQRGAVVEAQGDLDLGTGLQRPLEVHQHDVVPTRGEHMTAAPGDGESIIFGPHGGRALLAYHFMQFHFSGYRR